MPIVTCFKLLLVEVKQKMSLKTILNLLKIKYYSSYQGFKGLQYAHLQIHLQIRKLTTWFRTWKVVRYFFKLNFFKFYLDLCLIFWFTSLRALFVWKNGYVTSIVSITDTVIFLKQELLRRRAARGSSGENKCSWNNGKIKQL